MWRQCKASVLALGGHQTDPCCEGYYRKHCRLHENIFYIDLELEKADSHSVDEKIFDGCTGPVKISDFVDAPLACPFSLDTALSSFLYSSILNSSATRFCLWSDGSALPLPTAECRKFDNAFCGKQTVSFYLKICHNLGYEPINQMNSVSSFSAQHLNIRQSTIFTVNFFFQTSHFLCNRLELKRTANSEFLQNMYHCQYSEFWKYMQLKTRASQRLPVV